MRVEQITFTRFIAAIAIVFFHYGKPLNIFSNEYVHSLLIQANIGVSYFFILSGFVMIIAYGQKKHVNFGNYMQNRFGRIYPLYFTAIFFSLLYRLIATINWESKDLLLNIFALQTWFPGRVMSINYPGWSISVEFFFYLCFPFLVNQLYKKLSFKLISLIILAFWIISQLFFNIAINEQWQFGSNKQTEEFLTTFPIFHLNQFLIGNWLGLLYISKPQQQKNYDLLVLFIGILIALVLIFRPTTIHFHNGLMAILFVPFIYFLSLNSGKITQLFNKKSFVYLGEISYSLYILQAPVYWFTFYFFQKLGLAGDLKLFIGTLFFLLIASSLAYHFIEVPMRNKIKKWKLAS